MTPIMKRTEKDDAVSPVVGVMLMLVVTIIIAAVVAAFASGVGTTVEKAPTAAVDVRLITANDAINDVLISHRSGDALPTKDIKITFAWKDGENYRTNSYSAASDTKSAASERHPAYQTALFLITGDTATANQFGDAVLTVGHYLESMTHYSDSPEGKAMKELFGSSYGSIKKNTPVRVTITHIPSSQIIYDKEVITE